MPRFSNTQDGVARWHTPLCVPHNGRGGQELAASLNPTCSNRGI